MTRWDSITTAIATTLSGDRARGRRALLASWEATGDTDHAQRCVLAHYLADLQPHLDDEVAWDERALAAYSGVEEHHLVPLGIPRAGMLAPSLHLNLGDGYLRQGRLDDAANQLAAGLAAGRTLGDDGYSALIHRGLSDLGRRIDQHRDRTSG